MLGSSLEDIVNAAHLSNGEILVRLAVGLGLGSAIGVQRELDGQDAGVRTHALLTLGATVFGLLSVGAFGAFVGPAAASNVQFDVGRIASYVVAAVGFLAGGTIVKNNDRVRGLTTAGSLWVSAAIGLAAGLGLLFAAAAAAIAALTLLVLEGPLERLFRKTRAGSIRAVVGEPIVLADLLAELSPIRIRPRSAAVRLLSDGSSEVTLGGIQTTSRDSVITVLESRTKLRELSWTDD